MKTISVIIITYNNREDLKLSLPSVIGQTYPIEKIWVMDNNSNDGGNEFITQNYPQIKLVKLPQNIGFSAANNIALDLCKTDYCLVLNPDVILEKEFVKLAVNTLNQHPEAGALSGKLLRSAPEDPNPVIDSTGILLNLKYLCPLDRGEQQLAEGNFEKEEYIFGASAAAAVYRKKALDEVWIQEYFDEDFFAYYEDVDLAWRLQLAGWKAIYCPQARAYHLRKGPQVKGTKIFTQAYLNRWFLLVKNESLGNFFSYAWFMIPYELGRFIRNIFRYPSLFLVLFRFIYLLPKMYRKRKKIVRH